MRRESMWTRLVLGGLALALAPMPVSLDAASPSKDGGPAAGSGSGGRRTPAAVVKSAPAGDAACTAHPAAA
jgi:hypothetical protein